MSANLESQDLTKKPNILSFKSAVNIDRFKLCVPSTAGGNPETSNSGCQIQIGNFIKDPRYHKRFLILYMKYGDLS